MDPELQQLIPEIIWYFDRQVLSPWRDLAHQYEVWTDHFVGHIRVRDIPGTADPVPYIRVNFGFRRRKNGDLALAVYMPDLLKYSPPEVQDRWMPFRVPESDLEPLPDQRFELWVERFLKGNWNVPNGPLDRTRYAIGAVNDLCVAGLDERLFNDNYSAGLEFPRAQNDHAYQDAHTRLYGLVVDGLAKKGLRELASRLRCNVDVDNRKTLQTLKKLLPQTPGATVFEALDALSGPRRAGSHNVRQPAQAFDAFERFFKDATKVADALELLRDWLAQEFGTSHDDCRAFLQAERSLPKFDPTRPAQPNWPIWRLAGLEGKEIERVEFGYEVKQSWEHDREGAIFYLSDGSRVAISTLSNAQMLVDQIDAARAEGKAPVLEANQFHVSLSVTIVPPKPVK